MAKFSSLFTDVLSQAKDCPKVVAINEIRNAAILLCEKSGVWSRNHDPIYTYKNGIEYELDDTPASARVHRVMRVKMDGKPMAQGIVTPDDLFEYAGERGTPVACAVVRPAVISLAPTPMGRHVLLMRVAYKPEKNSMEMDDDILDEWREAIIHGALYKLKMMVGKPWSDPKSAATHKSFFDKGVSQAKMKAIRGYGNSSQSVRPRSFV